jgi:glutaconate CoA-transferase subunit B
MSRYTMEELLACEVSRHLEDGVMGFIGGGTGGPAFIMAVGIPAVASRLAQLKHAPDFMVMFGPIIDPLLDSKYLPRATYEYDMIHWPCRSQLPIEDALMIFKRGKMGVGFVSAAQIDTYGNLNISAIGDYHHPKVRLPGPLAQTDHLAHAKSTIVLMKHTKRNFVEKVDFITAVGHENREGLKGGGPSLVVSDLAVMDFNQETKKMRLKSIHPWSSAQEVLDHTGFNLEMPDHITVTPKPSEQDLHLIRTQIDADRLWLEAKMSLVPSRLTR